MHGDDMPNQFLQFVGGMPVALSEMREIFGQADFMTVNRIRVQPDTLLREFRVVELRPEAIRIVVDPLAANRELTGRDLTVGADCASRAIEAR